ncbi:PAS domain S-box protein, partial [Candidatus Aerophobetes bacterium]|nr:PAS domain S-box protein [Candidatus Aerophobetes bacterium]
MSLNKIRYSYSALQEKMWIEIIQEMENLYAKLANNLTEIEKKTRELSEAREFVENVLNSMSDTLIVTDKKGIIRKVNRAALNLLGYQEEEILGKLFEKLLLSSKKEKFSIWRKITAGKNAQFYQNFLTKKGEKIPASFNTSFLRNKEGKIAGVIVVGRDLRKIKQLLKTAREAARAERKKAKELEKAYHYLQNLQTKLIQSEKLASIGRLAAGVAHEINNPLTAVLTFAHLLLRSMPEDDPRRADVEVIIREANHCRMITRNLLDFARQTQPNKRPVDIKQIVEKTLSLVKNQVSFQNIRIIKEFNISLPLLNVDPNQMEQVFM